MSTALSLIFAAIDARLEAVTGLQSYEREPSGDPDAFPAIEVNDLGDDEAPEGDETGTERRTLSISVAGFVEGLSGPAAHDALAELHAAAVKALCGDPGFNLGGLAESVARVGRRRVAVAELASSRRLGFAQDFEITFATPRGDPAILL
jgi:hypothetical protein